MSPVVLLLREARSIVAEPHHWTKGFLARGPDGKAIDYTSSDACCFCAFGAVCLARKRLGLDGVARDLATDALRAVLPTGTTLGLSSYNDDRPTTHADVIDLFDRAIAAAEAEDAAW